MALRELLGGFGEGLNRGVESSLDFALRRALQRSAQGTKDEGALALLEKKAAIEQQAKQDTLLNTSLAQNRQFGLGVPTQFDPPAQLGLPAGSVSTLAQLQNFRGNLPGAVSSAALQRPGLNVKSGPTGTTISTQKVPIPKETTSVEGLLVKSIEAIQDPVMKSFAMTYWSSPKEVQSQINIEQPELVRQMQAAMAGLPVTELPTTPEAPPEPGFLAKTQDFVGGLLGKEVPAATTPSPGSAAAGLAGDAIRRRTRPMSGLGAPQTAGGGLLEGIVSEARDIPRAAGVTGRNLIGGVEALGGAAITGLEGIGGIVEQVIDSIIGGGPVPEEAAQLGRGRSGLTVQEYVQAARERGVPPEELRQGLIEEFAPPAGAFGVGAGQAETENIGTLDSSIAQLRGR